MNRAVAVVEGSNKDEGAGVAGAGAGNARGRAERCAMDGMMSWTAEDEAIKATNNDASECKRCAVELGYWRDDYISYFVKHVDRKAPEINRGYYARVRAVEIFIHQFLERCGTKCQIVNLGCGYDTLFWRLKNTTHDVSNFVELDFPSVTAKKAHVIKRNKQLLEKICGEDGEVMLREGELHSDGYHLVGCDLRCLPEVRRKLEAAALRPELPTLVLAECVLVYLRPEASDALLAHLAHTFPCALLLSYEQCNLTDKFGEVMLKNLSARGCPLAGERYCQSLAAQDARFLAAGWHWARSWDMETVWRSFAEEDRVRVERLEMLDERELLLQLNTHYCLSVAARGDIFRDVDLNA